MTRDEFRALNLTDLKKMTSLEIWEYIVEYFHSNNLHYEDKDLYFDRDENLLKFESEDEAWRYALGLYDYYCTWA